LSIELMDYSPGLAEPVQIQKSRSSMSRSVVALSGNPRPRSRTAALALTVARAVVELGPAGPVVEMDLSNRASSDADLRAIVAEAEVAVVASPTYKATYTGLLKSFLDGVPTGALRDVIAIPVMVAGDRAHALAVDVHLRPLLLELGATTPTPGLFVEEPALADPAAAIAPWLEAATPALEALLRARVPA
jgi:FMN reductase